jgi:hypothetical protein
MLSATSRIAFMRKYSTINYCRYMCKAVDMWAETAIYLLALVEVLAVERKVKEGSAHSLLPLDPRHLFSSFKKRVPALLSSTASSLVPISLPSRPGEEASLRQEVPLSSSAVLKVLYINGILIKYMD